MSEFNPVIEELLSSSIDLPVAERRAYLVEACSDDGDLERAQPPPDE